MGNWVTTTPAGTDLISQGDDVIREMKVALEEALSEEAIFPGSAPTTAPVFKWTGKRGNTAGRPASPDTGEIYFNTQLFQMEYYDGATWTAYDMVPLLGITTAKINDLAVTTGKINDLGVTTGKINDLAVTTGKINDLGVTTGKIAALAVTDAKVNDVAVGKLTGTLPVASGGTGITTKMMVVGSYTGNGGSSRNIAHNLGATPDFVIISVNSNGGNVGHFFITGMPTDQNHDFNGTYAADGIRSVDATNIVIGANANVNQNGVAFVFIAFKAN